MLSRVTFVALLAVVAATACSRSDAAAKPPAPAAAKPSASGTYDIVVTEEGFRPDKLKVKKGQPVKLSFTRKTETTCAKQVVLQLGGGKKIEKPLPLDETVVIDATFAEAGELKYACSMDMFTGVVVVE
jgi:plastocyanin domain-containing protein